MNHCFYDSDGQIAADMSQFNPVYTSVTITPHWEDNEH